MTISFQTSRSSAKHKVREREMIMRVAIAHVAAVQNHRMVEQRTISITGRPHFLDELRKQSDVIGLDLDVLIHLVRAILMVRYRMVTVRHTDLRIRAIADLTGNHERDDTGDICLI